MFYPKYQINFMPEAFPGYCSTACLMGILNYFWYTTFNMKDTWDIIRIGKLGKYKYGDMLDQIDIAYCLYQLGFDINIYYEISETDHDFMITDPVGAFKKNLNPEYHKNITGDSYTHTSGLKMKIESNLLIKIRDKTDIQQFFDVDFAEVIKKDQNEDTLFLLGLDGYILINEPYPSEDFVSGHIVLCKGYKDGNFEIYDSGPAKNPFLVSEERLKKAMNMLGKYTFLKIQFNNL